MQVLLFCLGLALGSFLHVLASRYDPERSVFTRDTLGGRSHCPKCKKTLAWYELIPLLSFLFQRDRCRGCGAKLEWSYFWVELLSGLIVAFVPWRVAAAAGPHIMGAAQLVPYAPEVIALSAIWTAAFLVLLLISLIDLRLQIIPNELVVLVGLLGLAAVIFDSAIDATSGFFWMEYLGSALGAALFFALLVAITRGRGMGMGDVKLAFALGLLFAWWPKIILLVMAAFIIGAVVGVALIALRLKSMKSAVPFGPFLAFAALLTFYLGDPLVYSFGLYLGW